MSSVYRRSYKTSNFTFRKSESNPNVLIKEIRRKRKLVEKEEEEVIEEEEEEEEDDENEEEEEEEIVVVVEEAKGISFIKEFPTNIYIA
ncbi:hypothetical protein V1478_015412 [Vespula squamosa]|uniref:Uncharacterized protein n=1 Tax=Vespula squamosa TaxID=30214 RepID=A0ABD2A509_VESSQ